jgi:hypothetical protein
MKVCPIQKYGMKAVMDHYIDNGEVLGKSSDELEGYSLPDKGYFRPGRLPSFDKDFFDMPRGRTEDLIIEEFRLKLSESNGNGSSDKVWEEYKVTREKALDRQSKTVDMGMDMIKLRRFGYGVTSLTWIKSSWIAFTLIAAGRLISSAPEKTLFSLGAI